MGGKGKGRKGRAFAWFEVDAQDVVGGVAISDDASDVGTNCSTGYTGLQRLETLAKKQNKGKTHSSTRDRRTERRPRRFLAPSPRATRGTVGL